MPVTAAAQQAQSGLKILVLEGEGAVYNIRERTAREAIVEIRDENDRPVANAVVMFTLPERGPGATFPGGERTLTVNTDAQGRAAARGIRPNNVAGQYEVRVDASFEGQTASTTISHSNILGAAAAGGIGGGTVAAIVGIVAGAAVGVALGLGGGGNGNGGPSPAPTPRATISPGQPTVQGP